MTDRPINNDDLITIIRPQGGNKPEYRTIEELNNKFSTYVDPVLIDLSSGTDYTIPTSLPPSIVIVTETDGSDGDIYLPPATGSFGKVTISVQKAANAITVNPAAAPGADTINLASSLSVTALSTVTLLDYALGKWMVI